MGLPHPSWDITDYGEAPLGQILADERFRYLLLQRTVAKDSGLRQPNLSAYERCRITPSWEVFVRVLAAMDRKAVIRTEPLHPHLRQIDSLPGAIEEVLWMIGERRYRLEDEAAAHVLGRCDRVSTLHVAFEADATELHELSERAVGRFTRVCTERGGEIVPQIRFPLHGGTVILSLVPKIPSSVEVAFQGLMVHVAPIEEIDLPAA